MEQRTWIGEVALHELLRSLRENGALLRIDESEMEIWKKPDLQTSPRQREPNAKSKSE